MERVKRGRRRGASLARNRSGRRWLVPLVVGVVLLGAVGGLSIDAVAIVPLWGGSGEAATQTARRVLIVLSRLMVLAAALCFLGRDGIWVGDNLILRQHRRRRVSSFERAARALTPLRRVRVADDLPRRMEAWRAALGTGRGLSSRSAFARLDPVHSWSLRLTVAALITAPALVPLLGNAPDLSGLAVCGLWLVLVGVICLGPVRLALIRRRLLASLDHRQCPNCGYDLASNPPAIAPELTGGYSAGPARCPECGSPWPLLPPPVEFQRGPVTAPSSAA